jgi:hypothetical protein
MCQLKTRATFLGPLFLKIFVLEAVMAALSVRVDDDAIEQLCQRIGLTRHSYSRGDLCEILNLSEASVDRLLSAKTIPSFRVTRGRVAIARRDLAVFLCERQRGSSPPPLPEPPTPKQPRRRARRPRRKDAGRKRAQSKR